MHPPSGFCASLGPSAAGGRDPLLPQGRTAPVWEGGTIAQRREGWGRHDKKGAFPVRGRLRCRFVTGGLRFFVSSHVVVLR